MKIAMIASEALPLCKTGGLADVIWSLSHELGKMGHEACIVLPFYKVIKDRPAMALRRLGSYEVPLSWRKQNADIFLWEYLGVKFYLIGNDYYFNRENLYGYDDDGERFAFYALSVQRLFPFLNLPVDVIHVHDWQAGMVPVLIKEQSLGEEVYQNTRFVMTLHNEAFKGYLDRYFLNHFFGLDDRIYESGAVRFDDMVSTLKSGIVYSDKVVAVSPSHAKELLSPGDPMRLDGVLRLRDRDFCGIVNGVDVEEFDPMNDPFLPKNYGITSFVSGKEACRKKLCFDYELENDDAPIFGLVSRLTFQKGIDLALKVGESILRHGGKFIVLGSGEEELQRQAQRLRDTYPTRCAIYIGYNNQLAHDIYAASDFFLMPSLFEPCGIGQMIAQRYGSLPIVRSVGGLKDTVIGFNGKNADVATGFSFTDYDLGALKATVEKALTVFADGKTMRKLIHNAMKTDHSWRKSAQEYLKLYGQE